VAPSGDGVITIDHQVAPILPANVFAAQRSATRRSGQGLASFGADETVFGETLFGEVVGEFSVTSIEIGIVITVVGAGVDRLSVTVGELLNLDVIQGGQGSRFGLLRM